MYFLRHFTVIFLVNFHRGPANRRQKDWRETLPRLFLSTVNKNCTATCLPFSFDSVFRAVERARYDDGHSYPSYERVYGVVQSPIPSRGITRKPSKYGLENVLSRDKRSVLEWKILRVFFFCKETQEELRYDGRMFDRWMFLLFFFFWNNRKKTFFWYFSCEIIWPFDVRIGFIENVILFVTLLFVILNNVQDNIWWKTRVKFHTFVTVYEGWDGSPFLQLGI